MQNQKTQATSQVQPDNAWSETEYFMKCSDCESEQERCFNAQQAAYLANRDGWCSLGSRIVCPKCAVGYSPQVRGKDYE